MNNNIHKDLADAQAKVQQVYYPEFHRLFKADVVEVCEGDGTQKDPCRLVYYIHEDGKLLGRLDTSNRK